MYIATDGTTQMQINSLNIVKRIDRPKLELSKINDEVVESYAKLFAEMH